MKVNYAYNIPDELIDYAAKHDVRDELYLRDTGGGFDYITKSFVDGREAFIYDTEAGDSSPDDIDCPATLVICTDDEWSENIAEIEFWTAQDAIDAMIGLR